MAGTKNYNGKYRSYTNKNKMLYNYEGANGIKTGYTVKAGRCLVSSAERGGMDIVCVVLNCYDMYERSQAILNDCFSGYNLARIDTDKYFMCGKVLCKISKPCNIVLKKGEKLSYKIISYNRAQQEKNDGAEGKIQILAQNNLIFEANLYSIVNR
ncbi:MAG: hypothetical protein LUI60_07220 [Clostridia bacterium]|nr:hypothetical protein [Clostridia bacterium]